MKKLLVAVLLLVPMLAHADVDWTRFRGKVKGLNRRAKVVTIEDVAGDVFTVPVTDDVKVTSRKGETLALKDVTLDMDVVLVRVPEDKPAPEKQETFDEMNAGKH